MYVERLILLGQHDQKSLLKSVQHVTRFIQEKKTFSTQQDALISLTSAEQQQNLKNNLVKSARSPQ